MANTERLDLYKVPTDPAERDNTNFNTETMLNDNWEKIDKMTALIDPVTGKLLPGQENPVDVSGIVNQLNEIETSVGNLTNLETVEKANLVGAINEVRKAIATHLADNEKHLIEGDREKIKSIENAQLFKLVSDEGYAKSAGTKRLSEMIESGYYYENNLEDSPSGHSSYHRISVAMSGSGSGLQGTLTNTGLGYFRVMTGNAWESWLMDYNSRTIGASSSPPSGSLLEGEQHQVY